MIEEKPLVTFTLFAYNQEKYIREAVEGAFSQDYSPLEIILSDDCSSDRTFLIMQEMVAAYQGPHSIVLNRNEKNLGIAGHINHVMSLVRSDFVVVAAGDDISIPVRVRKLVEMWLVSKKKLCAIFSGYTPISDSGRLLESAVEYCDLKSLNSLDAHASGFVSYLGATAAYSVRIFREFQGIIPGIYQEDSVLPARAALLGGVGCTEEILISYRVGSGISTGKKKVGLQYMQNWHRQRMRVVRQKRTDFILRNEFRGREKLFAKQMEKELLPLYFVRKGLCSLPLLIGRIGVNRTVWIFGRVIKNRLQDVWKRARYGN